MKRHGNLYEKICCIENLREAHRKARVGKAHYREVQMVNNDEDTYYAKIHDVLCNKSYADITYEIKTISDTRKQRTIYVLKYYPHRIVQWAMAIVLVPIWKPTLIRDTYSSIDGRGLHDASRRIKQWMQDKDATRFCLKTDVRHFYPSVDHGVMKRVVRQKIKCRDTLWLLDTLIDSAPGLPIGNYLSQYLGNLYLSEIDHWIKQDKRVKHYVRYCDDMVIFGPDKDALSALRCEIVQKMTALRLTMKSNWQVFPTATRGLDFIGYRFFGTHTLVRKSIKLEFQAVVRRIKKQWRCMNPSRIINTIMSYYGWLLHCNGRHLWETIIDSDVRKIIALSAQRSGIRNPMERLAW